MIEKTGRFFRVRILLCLVVAIFAGCGEEEKSAPPGDFPPAARISVYFSPPTDLNERLSQLIDSAKVNVEGAFYSLRSPQVTQALLRASARGVGVRVILDDEQKFREGSAYPRFKNFHLVRTDTDRRALMHNKFCIFEKNKGCDKLERAKGRSIVYTGSFNLTWKANYVNQENVCFMDDSEIVQKYKERFEKIKDEVFLLQENLTGARRSIYTKKDVSQGKLEKKTNEQANILDEPSSLCDENDDESENFDGLAFEF